MHRLALLGLLLLAACSKSKPDGGGSSSSESAKPKEKWSLAIPARHVYVDLRFSRESLHAIDQTGEVTIFDLNTGKEVFRLPSSGAPDAGASNAVVNGKVVKPLSNGAAELVVGSTTICVHTIASSKNDCIQAPEPVVENVTVAVSPDERMCAYLGTKTIRVLELPKLR